MKFICVFSFAILPLILCSATFPDKTAPLHYNKGVELQQQGKVKEAVNELKKAIKADKKFAPAHSKLAEIYMEQGTLQGRTKAEKEINKALKLEPKNPKFNLVRGLLMVKQGFTYNAKDQFKKVTNLDQKCAEAYYNLGLLHENDMLRYKDMISEGGLIQLSGFGKKFQAKAIECFEKVLEIDPHHRDALVHLASIYLETDNFNKMIDLLEQMVKEDSLDKDAHLFLGLGYHRLGKYEEANEEYQMARSLMSEEERKVFDSVEPILSLREKKEHRRSGNKSEYIKSFWKKRDPLFLTEYNERVLEHYNRVAYANLRFGVPKLGIEGYKTDRGQIYIRYGEPKIKNKIRPEIDGNNVFYPTTDVWLYGDFQFVFEDSYSSGEYTFSDAMPGTPSHIGSRYPGSYTQQAAELRIKMPEIYEYKIEGKKFELPHLWVNFKANEGKNLVKISYGIPSKIIEDSHSSLIQKGIFLFDEKWNEVYKDRQENAELGPKVVSPNGNLYVEEKELRMMPESYHLAIEVRDKLSGNVGIIREDMLIEPYDSISLQLSDISVVLKLVLANDSVATVMNPVLTYLKLQPIHVYYEIYNLQKNQMGKTNYQVDYSVYREPKDEKGFTKAFKRLGELIGISKKRAVVTLFFKGKGPVADKPQNVTIDMADTDEGEYKLIVTLTDLNSGKQTAKEIKFKKVGHDLSK
jgi:GWxTD domain-containing protein